MKTSPKVDYAPIVRRRQRTWPYWGYVAVIIGSAALGVALLGLMGWLVR